MLSLSNLQVTNAGPAFNIQLQEYEKAVLMMPDEVSRDILLACLKGQQKPTTGSVTLPDAADYAILPPENEAEKDSTLKTVLTGPFKRLLTSLRKYEQLSIQMTKHFSPMQLGGYMEEMEQLEELINEYNAWDLEANLKAWQNGLQLPDLSTSYHEAAESEQWAVLLTRAFVLPAHFTILPDPNPILNKDQDAYLKQQLTSLSGGWLVISTTDQAQNWPEAYQYWP